MTAHHQNRMLECALGRSSQPIYVVDRRSKLRATRWLVGLRATVRQSLMAVPFRRDGLRPDRTSGQNRNEDRIRATCAAAKPSADARAFSLIERSPSLPSVAPEMVSSARSGRRIAMTAGANIKSAYTAWRRFFRPGISIPFGCPSSFAVLLGRAARIVSWRGTNHYEDPMFLIQIVQ
jgi:hypothetical protein